MKSIFNRKNEEPPLQLDLINMNTVSMKELKRSLTTTNIRELRLRLDALKRYRQKMLASRKPLETPQEKKKRLNKFNDIIHAFQQELTNRDKQEKEKQSKEDITWNKENVPLMLSDLRYTIVNQVQMKTYRLTDVKWIKPTSETIKFVTNTKRKITFSLVNNISTQVLKRLMNSQLSPIYFAMETSPTNRIRNGRPVMLIRDSKENVGQEMAIKPFTETYLAIMRV